MKKLLLVASAIALLSTTTVFADEAVDPYKPQTLPAPLENTIKIKMPDSVAQQNVKTDVKKAPRFDVNKFEDELGLTDAQKAQAKEIREKAKESSKGIFEQIKTKKAEIKELKNQLKEIRVQSKKDFEAILTEDQLKKLETIRQERKQQFEKAKKSQNLHKKGEMKKGCKVKCKKDKKAVETK